VVHIESSDSSVEFGALRAKATAIRDRQVPKVSLSVAQVPQCPMKTGPCSELADECQRQRRTASVSIGDRNRKSSVSSSAADMLSKLTCVRRKMKLTHDVTTAV